MSRLSIEVTPEEHRHIRVLASLHGQKIRDFVLERVFGSASDGKKTEKRFSKETQKALEDLAKGKNLKRYKDVDALFKDLRS